MYYCPRPPPPASVFPLTPSTGVQGQPRPRAARSKAPLTITMRYCAAALADHKIPSLPPGHRTQGHREVDASTLPPLLRHPRSIPRQSHHTLSSHEPGRLQALGDGVEVDAGRVEVDDASVLGAHGRL